ncbi:hypothetical protein [Brenneria rubrifaciens]|uniref:Uncharacterized protein n=1 Tax=Brenneria rubrifaciens TaxID=55213 RepID=A0A4V1F9U7_9GAMM|nr:hypothetical protein [Brenneria rubrifaciens]QCR08813.1 hypothetical protein EH207_09870 [Brenneria rubrifaciens]
MNNDSAVKGQGANFTPTSHFWTKIRVFPNKGMAQLADAKQGKRNLPYRPFPLFTNAVDNEG